MQRIGVIIVGPSGSGKSTVWRLLQTALASMEHAPILHIVNPKAMPRHQLLGRFFMFVVLPISSCVTCGIFEARRELWADSSTTDVRAQGTHSSLRQCSAR